MINLILQTLRHHNNKPRPTRLPNKRPNRLLGLDSWYNRSMRIDKYTNEIKNIYDFAQTDFLFRGQSNYNWTLNSSAYRRIKKTLNIVTGSGYKSIKEATKPRTSPDPSDKSFALQTEEGLYLDIKDEDIKKFKTYNTNIIEKLRLKNYTDKPLQNYSDLQILIELQHLGAATCLVDFTRNFLISLWFACQNTTTNPSDGAIFVIDAKKLNQITSKDLIKPIEEFIHDETLWVWTPGNTNNRILAQNSVCIFGALFLEKNDFFKKIKISSEDKETILYELDTIFNINFNSLFPDLYGFATNQSQTQSIENKINYKAILCHIIEEERWEEAEKFLINFPNLLNAERLYLFLKKGLNLKNILKSYKKHTTENTLQSFEFNMFIDALAGYGFSEEKYKKHISSDDELHLHPKHPRHNNNKPRPTRLPDKFGSNRWCYLGICYNRGMTRKAIKNMFGHTHPNQFIIAVSLGDSFNGDTLDLDDIAKQLTSIRTI